MPVLQTPFSKDSAVAFEDLERLVDDAIRGGAAGLLAPAVASEVEFLSPRERRQFIRVVARAAGRRVPFIVGASSDSPAEAGAMARLAEQVGAAAYLVAVPGPLYASVEALPGFFGAVAAQSALPLVVQDLQWHGPGLSLSDLRRLREAVPTLAGIKIETVPSGPKYSLVQAEFGAGFYICGGWAVAQLIEALDRGVDAMIPEASMVRTYRAIYEAHVGGRREKAVAIFRELLPVIAFTNQEIGVSIAFFKRLLVHKGIFHSDAMRRPGFTWDAHNRRVADELIEHYLAMEERLERADA